MNERIKLDHFVVVGGMSWGKAEEIDEAFWNWFKHERPKRDMTLHVRQTTKDAYVDEMGTLYAPKETIKLPDIKLTKKFIDKYDDMMGDLEEFLLIPINEAQDLDAAYEGVEKIEG